MYTLRIKSCGTLVSSWPVDPNVNLTNLVKAIDDAAQFLRRWGPVHIWVDVDNVSHLIGTYEE